MDRHRYNMGERSKSFGLESHVSSDRCHKRRAYNGPISECGHEM